jgi:hypothetical protein
VDRHICPALGTIPLTRLRARDLDGLHGSLKAGGMSPKTIRNYQAILSSSLHRAERRGWVRHKVAELAKPPGVTAKRVKAPWVDEIRRIIEVAEGSDPRPAPLLMLGGPTGTGRGEMAGTVVPEEGFVSSPYGDGSKPFRPDNVTGLLCRLRNVPGLTNVRLHDLRRFTATQLIGAGVDVRTVAGRLGTATPPSRGASTAT